MGPRTLCALIITNRRGLCTSRLYYYYYYKVYVIAVDFDLYYIFHNGREHCQYFINLLRPRICIIYALQRIYVRLIYDFMTDEKKKKETLRLGDSRALYYIIITIITISCTIYECILFISRTR